jgi:NDP-sugar pyrophosphorylase family protein
MKIKLIVLAGGMATRIMPLTQGTPKNLLPILGKPFVDYQFDIFKDNCFFDITFCLGHLGIEVQNYINELNRHAFGNTFTIDFSHDGAQSLGTGGAIAKSLSTFSGNFAVMYGDSYLTANLQDIASHFEDNSNFSQISVTTNVSSLGECNVVIREGVLVDIGKGLANGTHAEYGFTLINRNSLENFIELNSQLNSLLSFDLTDFLISELRAHRLSYYETPQSYWEIGSFDGIKRFEEYVKGNHDVRY